MDVQKRIHSLIHDANLRAQRDSELVKVFQQAELTEHEQVLVMDRINQHFALNIAIAKLKPFIK
jgi:hypothetical protein